MPNLLAKGERLAWVAISLGSLYARLDKCSDIDCSLGRYQHASGHQSPLYVLSERFGALPTKLIEYFAKVRARRCVLAVRG